MTDIAVLPTQSVELVGPEHLTPLTERANEEHDAGLRAASDALSHWLNAGDFLIRARDAATEGRVGWLEWVEKNFHGSYATATALIRMATYRSLLEDEQDVTNVAQALRYLRGLPESAPRGPRGGFTRSDPDGDLAVEARRLLQQGATQKVVAQLLGVSEITVWRWKDPARSREKRANEARARRARAREVKKALEQSRREAVINAVGGGVPEAYSLIRKTLQALDRAHGEASDRDVRSALAGAMARLHRAEDDIVRALGVS